nr:MAG TPA: hypothetical protein [Caudoviricetes sp.]
MEPVGVSKNLLKQRLSDLLYPLLYPLKKLAKITSQSCIKIYLNYTTFPLSILHESVF